MKIMGVKKTKSISQMELIILIEKTLQLDIVLICKSCKQLLNTNKINIIILMCKHIYNERNFSFVMTLNKLEECFVAPQMAFAQIYQLNMVGVNMAFKVVLLMF
jgi:hypothetical protein